MSHLLLVGLAIGVSMFARDIAYTTSTAFIAHGKGWPAAACDVLGDWATLISIGGGATEAWHGGTETLLVVAVAIAIGSALGTHSGVWLEAWLEKKLPILEEEPNAASG